MDQAKRTAYVKIINALFDGAVKVQPGQITETVVDMADKMFDVSTHRTTHKASPYVLP